MGNGIVAATSSFGMHICIVLLEISFYTDGRAVSKFYTNRAVSNLVFIRTGQFQTSDSRSIAQDTISVFEHINR